MKTSADGVDIHILFTMRNMPKHFEIKISIKKNCTTKDEITWYKVDVLINYAICNATELCV